MSDERHIEAAFLHADGSAMLQWHGQAPDEAMMDREEGEARNAREDAREAMTARRLVIQKQLLVYLFADGQPRCWQNVALRSLAVMRRFTPGELCGRSFHEVEGIRHSAQTQPSFPLEEFSRMTQDDEDPDGGEREEIIRRVLRYFFPRSRAEGSDWLKEGCVRVFLIARNYHPELVKVGEQELTYEELAWMFGELSFNPHEMRETIGKLREKNPALPLTAEEIEAARARSRLSARAQKLIRLPIERAGGKVRMQFGKTSETRAKYAAAAKGNGNRRKSA